MKLGDYKFSVGMVPGLAPDLAVPGSAELSRDVRIEDGQLRRVANESFVVTPAKVGTKKSIYKYGTGLGPTQYWFHWLNDTDVARSPAVTDTTERTYYTESGQVPKVTDNSIALAGTSYPFASYTLGLPSGAASTIAASGAVGPSTTQVTAVAVVTFVSGWGEDGPPSAPSNEITINDGQTLDFTGLPGAPAGAYNVTLKRLYVSAFNSAGIGAYKLFAEIPIASGTYSATLTIADLGADLPSPFLIAPPTNLFGIGLHPGKFLFGFSGRLFCRSEVNRPYGWPAEYQDPVDYEIVGGALMGASVVICTPRSTFIAEGSDPLNFSIRKIEGLGYPCVAKRSIVKTDQGVAYASDSGLVIVAPDGSGAMVTRQLIGVDAWRAYNPASFTAVFYDGKYIAFYDNGAQGSIILDLVNKTFEESVVYATAAWAEPGGSSRGLFLQVGNDIVKWRGDVTNRSLLWRSVARQLDRKRGFGAARVVATTYPVTFKLIQDGVTTSTTAIASRKAIGIPYVEGASYQYEVSGGDQIKSIEIADSKVEFIGMQKMAGG